MAWQQQQQQQLQQQEQQLPPALDVLVQKNLAELAELPTIQVAKGGGKEAAWVLPKRSTRVAGPAWGKQPGPPLASLRS